MSICSTGLSDGEFGPIVVKPKEARRMLACGNTRLYELIAAHELESFVDGRSRKITTKSIFAYIAKHLRPATDAEPGRLAHNQMERATAASLAARAHRKTRRQRPPAGRTAARS
jgi:hypothetical protein